MQICQNPNCSNPFNPDSNRFCTSCGQNNFGNLLGNRYRVLQLLGEGGFGRTYTAEDTGRFDDICVIKQFFPQVQGTAALTKATELFKQEAKRLYELGENHSQIPRLLAYFEQGASLYLVQEFIRGQTLLKELQQQAFSEAQIRELLADLLPVLQFIHHRHVIHRDIKPENIMRRQSDRKLILIDFGGAKQVTQTSLARQATGIYTVGYAPSEQMAGFATPLSDLYALGATCARLLTQSLAVEDTSGNLHDRVYDAFNGQWLWREILQEKGVTISDDLGQIIDKLLKHLPKERYQSAAEVLEDLNSPKPKIPTTIISIPQPQLPKVQANTISLQTFEFDVVTVDATGKQINYKRHSANFFIEDLGNGVILEMVSIPGGTFIMGSPDNKGKANERPQHQVTVREFLMGKYQITQAQYEAIMGNNPAYFRTNGANRPVENVSWKNALEFCQKLSQKTKRNYRLPSEAEWEYACRAGTTTPFYFGETITVDLANYNGNYTYASAPKGQYRGQTTPVGNFPPNAFGLYDMHGNVWEWCQDYYHNNYQYAPIDGSAWLQTGLFSNLLSDRLVRGGSWGFLPEGCRSANRKADGVDLRFNSIGFRVVFVLP
ncbi:serine/threonine protein kinase [Nostoc linckia z18]|uniref:Serine/threonine protein kinase n=2 Tax=Nostoc linckia TaxID=92942 RepID=A0A9Q5ZAV6_NOSLI|nr:bifunctional serine/threonine-protein kinase/formylglycine-generating enzyme family protein [Nostoc linckia]PHK47837.1 serine/threonine protein kinase [Nostoc linckia z16]PHJ57773.1 serine/threonine protein kinase [Nostoc linckia z1]PHJ60284.1 serine/threonine protein kinase [Nostoc linckia z3]PHJ76673.1 serine/threonine protein kinase [Nostoc linckia z4]PHJ77044.1 serine/threonine protein kinase [Nostoc linckia z2]